MTGSRVVASRTAAPARAARRTAWARVSCAGRHGRPARRRRASPPGHALAGGRRRAAARPPVTAEPSRATRRPRRRRRPTPARPSRCCEPGDRGERVRELQARLFQLAWLPELTTGAYDAASTGRPCRAARRSAASKATGVVDRRSWRRLKAMTKRRPTTQMFNILEPGPALLAPGAEGEKVRDLQARLEQIAWFFGDVTGTYDAGTVEAVRGFQAKRGIPVTGGVDRRTLDRLHAMTATPTHDREVQHRHGAWRARRALPGRPGAVRRQDEPHDAVGHRREGAQDDGRAVRVDVRHPDPRGLCSTSTTRSRDHVSEPLRHLDAVRDVLLRRPGRALLVRLRVGRLQRRLPRMRQRPRLRGRRVAVRPGAVGDKVVVYWS